MCGSTKYLDTHPMDGSWKFWGGGGWGSQTPKFCIGKYAAKLEIPGGWGGSNKKTISGGDMDIFWNKTIPIAQFQYIKIQS